MSTVLERQEISTTGTGMGDSTNVVVLNDNHNTFEGVAGALNRIVPGCTLQQGFSYAETIHRQGQAIVWTGIKEVAELYWEQLRDAGLTMAPLD